MTARPAILDGRADEIVSEARRWIGTPYKHRASLRGDGADCLGLIRGIWRHAVGPEELAVPIYSARWIEDGPKDTMLLALRSTMIEIDQTDACPGDVVTFRFRARSICKHAGVLSYGHDPERPGRLGLIHAYSRRGVVETSFDATWQRRAAAYFRFPARSS